MSRFNSPVDDDNYDLSFLGEKFDDNEPITETEVDEGEPEGGMQVQKPEQLSSEEPKNAGGTKQVGEEDKQKTATQQPDANEPKHPLGTSGFFTNNKGDIVDQQNKVIARAGNERRLWQEARRATNEAATFEMQLNHARKQLEGRNEITQLQTEHGISIAELKESIGIVAAFKRNPADAVRDVVARALAQGYTLDQLIGQEHIGAINTAAIKQMMDQNRVTANQETPEQIKQREVQEAYNNFISEHEYSEVHADAIGNLATNKGISPEKAYYELKLFATKHGFDFTQPLGPQIAAKRAQEEQGNRPQGQQPQQRVPKPMLNGTGAQNAQVASQDEPVSYGAADDWKSIVMRELRAARGQ